MNKQGYALIELVMASFMFGAVLLIGNLFWSYTTDNYNFSVTQYQLTENASHAVTTISHELKSAQDSMDGAYPLFTVNDNEIVFFSDVDYDSVVERVHYWITGTNLMRGVVEPSGNPPTYVLTSEKSKIIAEKIDLDHTPVFTYYNGNWPGDTTNNPLVQARRQLETRMIKIIIPVLIQDNQQTRTYTEQTTVQIRNMKDNL